MRITALAHLQEKAPRGATCPGRRGRVFFVSPLYVRVLQSARFGYRQTGRGKPKRTHEKGGEWPYKQAVGGLLWISGMTRPGIASAVRAVARHAHNPAARHWKAVRKIIAYLKAPEDLGVVFQRGGDLKLSFADADYADRCNDRRSVSGVAVMLRNTAVSASSTTQHCVTLSTSEAEYVAMAHGENTALEIKAVLDSVQPHLSGRAIGIYEDNEGAKPLAENPQGSQRIKHIDVRFHFLRGLVR